MDDPQARVASTPWMAAPHNFSGWVVIHPEKPMSPASLARRGGFFGSHNGVFFGFVNWTGGTIRSSDTLQEGQSLGR